MVPEILRWLPAAFLFVLACQEIPLTELDLGRHLANGRAVLAGQWAVLFTNFHSADQAGFPVVNHHWLAGVIFAGVHGVAGWAGLVLLQAAGMAAALRIAAGRVDPRFGLCAAPLLITRWPVRPEVFTLLFLALLLADWKWRPWWLGLLFALWVNLHLGFAVGLAVVGVAVLTGRFSMAHLAAACAGCLVNPNTWRGALEPLLVWRNYDYPIGENQPLWYWVPLLTSERPLFALWLLAVVGLVWWGWRGPRDWFALGVAALGAAMSLFLFRNLSVFGLCLLPLCRTLPWRAPLWAVVGLAVLATRTYWEGQGLGLTPGAAEALVQVQAHSLAAPVFNSFDVGSFLDYAAPGQAWVDNRPEAYPPGFFRERLRGPMEDEKQWRRLDAERRFRMLVLSPGDQTAWAQQFLARRREDWRVAFENEVLVVLVR